MSERFLNNQFSLGETEMFLLFKDVLITANKPKRQKCYIC
jgi:hypothetical protein